MHFPDPASFISSRKRIITIILAGLCAAAMFHLGMASRVNAAEAAESSAAPPEGREVVIAYYFHGTIRCVACVDIEKAAREAVFDDFSMELREGKLEWRAVNYEAPKNGHFSTDYELPHPSLVLVRERAGFPVSHQVLPKTWELSDNPAALSEYVQNELMQFLLAP
jgi:hypothetical protein